MSKEHTIMYIDDEEPNLVAFRAIFRREFHIITATSADQANEILLNNQDIKVIISDNRMQGLTGIEFFESLIARYPDPVRIILTGFADQSAMIDSINKANVFRFLSKPWNEYDLRQTIKSAIEIHDTRIELRVKQKMVESNLFQVNKFIHAASNEMRSTLVSMHGIVRLVMNGDENLPISDFLPLLDKGIVQIDLQLRNIIDHYNNSKTLTEIESIDLAKLVERVKQHLSSLYEVDALRLRISQQGKSELISDAYKIQLLFYNLITHALNNRHEGQEVLDVDVEISSKENGVQVMFTDNGKTIDLNTSGSIFEALISGKGKNNITLMLVKDAITALNGSLEIDTVPNAGTSYTIIIPNQAISHEDPVN